MPKSTEAVNIDLKNLLDSRGFDVTMRTSSGETVPVPDNADAFIFNFKDGGENLGTVTLTVDDSNNLTVWYNTEVMKGNGAFIQFVKQLRKFAQKRCPSFKMDDIGNLENEMKVREHNKKINEGYYGTRSTSYSDNGPATIKMIIKHNRPLDENDARFRYVERIFLENQLGERVLVPSTRPGVGRVFARHLAEGGQYNDQRWNHIAEVVEDVKKLGGFVRATRNGQFNESVQRVVTEAQDKYQQLRESLKRMQSSRGYNAYFESWTPTLMEDDDTSNLTELFKSSTLDARIEGALPTLKKFNITVTETADVSVFENWADSILDEMMNPSQAGQKDDLLALIGPDSDEMPLGPDASSAIGELAGILEDDKLNARLRRAAVRDTDRDARSIIIGWMSEQPGTEYAEILNKIEAAPEQAPPAPEPKPKPTQKQEPTELPDLPPVKESEDISALRRLSGL